MTHATEWMALRAERDALADENRRLREALREFSIVPFRELSDQCVLCGEVWDGDERHAPGCLAKKGGQMTDKVAEFHVVEAAQQGQMYDTREPTPEERESPLFNAVWQSIKGWDLERWRGSGYSGATGTDVCRILDAIRPHILAACAEERRAALTEAAERLPMYRHTLVDSGSALVRCVDIIALRDKEGA